MLIESFMAKTTRVPFSKYQACGNDYIVIDPKHLPGLSPSFVKLVCDRNLGIGSDGILYGPLGEDTERFELRIFNPDGSEAEKSGNGIRIFSRFLYDNNLVECDKPFYIETLGGKSLTTISQNGTHVSAGMGRASFIGAVVGMRSSDTGESGEIINQRLKAKECEFQFCAVSVGNPHCVITLDQISDSLAKEYGPFIENHELFPKRINVQFMRVIDRNNIEIQIWERGAGYTLSSGSSSCAAASTALKLGLCDSPVKVHMPGGVLDIEISPDFELRMQGPVAKVFDGTISEELFHSSAR